MATASRPVRTDGPPTSRPSRRVSRRGQLVRWLRESGLGPLLALAALSMAIGVLQVVFSGVVPLSTLLIPMVIGNLVLGPRLLPVALVFIMLVMVVVVCSTTHLLDARRVGGVVVVFLVALLVLGASLRRGTLGLAGMHGESMLVDLRDRINRQATMPELPEGWYAEAELRSAGRSSFAGDFVVGSRAGDVLQVAVVDVSGKGAQAGSRALLLSGAFGGLLGALPPDRFLEAANEYLLRQDWDEGFATAVHVSVRLSDGCFELRSAGHPPGAQLVADSARWSVHEAEGPALGLVSDAEFGAVRGTLDRGDALLLFTDGLVESPERDMASGIAELLREGDDLLRTGITGSARRLVDTVGSLDDDRALLVLHRRPR